jgi:hypothetical protein
MISRAFIVFLWTALCCVSAPSQAAEIPGPWKIDTQNGPSPICGLEQVGNSLTGSCIGPRAKGPIVGTINGDKVGWRWEWMSYTGNSSGTFEFMGSLRPDNTITGMILQPIDSLGNTLARGFTAKRLPPQRPISPALQRQMATPTPLSPVEQQKAQEQARLPDMKDRDAKYQAQLKRVEQLAVQLFPWVGQADQRSAFIANAMQRYMDNEGEIDVARALGGR